MSDLTALFASHLDISGPTVRRLWIEALESGDYMQDAGSHTLQSDEGWTALGVLCDLAVQAGIIQFVTFWEAGKQRYLFGRGSDMTWAELPEPVRLWAGLSERAERAVMRLEDYTLLPPVGGDDVYRTFAQIAREFRTAWKET